MPKVGKEYKQSRKIQILQAAAECFSDQGFHQTSMRDICNKAELSAGAVYNYFAGKDDIIESMAEVSRNSVKDLFQDIRDTDSRKQVIDKILHKLLEVAVYQKENNQLNMNIHLWSEALRSDKIKSILMESSRNMNAIIHDRLKNSSTKGNPSKLSDKQVISLILMAYQGLVLQMALTDDVNEEEYFEALSTLLTNLSSI
ncbi:MAG TPA: TetR/AcrR family transcriptional regulator [Balneolales bacterium]|nr:TetR/AcrR family transcriptional regulator [Balneolales bacterium]